MDSFYDAPRRPPPLPISQTRLSATPIVPEISVLCPSKSPGNNFTPYSQWRQDHNHAYSNFLFNKGNKENISENNSILKKQVRFEGPGSQGPQVINRQPVSPECLKPAATSNSGQKVFNSSSMPNFEQMYMANIPNRQLDLSVIDVSKKPLQIPEQPEKLQKAVDESPKEKDSPRTYKEFLESQKVIDKVVLNDSVTDILNYKAGSAISDTKKEIDVFSFNPQKFENYYEKVMSDRFSPMTEKPKKQYFHRPSSPLTISKTFEKINTGSCSSEGKIEPLKPGNDHYEPQMYQTNTNMSSSDCKSCKCFRKPDSDSKALKLQTEEDLSVRDLLKIIAQQSQQIAQQNNQLMLLQQQVSELVVTHKNCTTQKEKPDSWRHKDEAREKSIRDDYVTSTQHVTQSNGFNSPLRKNRHLPDFAIGLTTSFEVAFRRPPSKGLNDNHQKNTNKLLTYEHDAPLIQEITETDSVRTAGLEKTNKETLVDSSLVLQEPIKIRESCPSPEPSINIDMNDFEDSDTDDDGSQYEATFYRNLMGQVNKILQKAQINTIQEHGSSSNLTNKTMHKVQEATLRHLKKIGLNIPKIEEQSQQTSSSNSTGSNSYDEDDVSFAVKQLLMKYLPQDYLSKVTESHQNKAKHEKTGAIKNRPEFSFATVQYMKKYNLIANTNKKEFPRQQKESECPKILDISKLKQQPKLL